MNRKFLSAPALLVAFNLLNNPTQAQVKNGSGEGDLPKSININSINSNGSDETEMNYTQGGHRYKVRLSGTKIAELYVDNKKIGESEFVKYEPAIKKILEQVEEDRRQAAIDRAEAEKHREQATKEREEVNKIREQARADREQADKYRAQARQDRERADQEREQANRVREQANRHREQAEKDRARAEVDRQKAEEDRKHMHGMFEELVNDKLVADQEALTSLDLDETRMLINGKEQPSNIHQRYKEKYLKQLHRRLQYRHVDGNRTFTVN